MDSMNENVIEFLRGQKTATVTFCSQNKLNTRVRKLAELKPEECQIVAENSDGSIVAHVPTKWIKINPTKELSEEAKQKLRERAAQFGFGKKADDSNCIIDEENDAIDEDEEEDDDLFDY